MRLEPDEIVYFRGHPSWRSRPGYCARGILFSLAFGVAAGLVSAAIDGDHRVRVAWVVAAVLASFAQSIARGQLRLARTTYVVTSRRLVIERGVLARRRREARLDRIQNVTVRQSLLQRVLRVGTVRFETAGELDSDFALRGVSEPGWIARRVDAALYELEPEWPPAREQLAAY